MTSVLAQVAFWGCAAILAYTFIGYPVLIACCARIAARPATKGGDDFLPQVSAIVVVRNGEERIQARVQNLLDADYPADKMEVIVVSDGSTDHTANLLLAMQDPRLRVIIRSDRKGKAAGLNSAIEQAVGEILVLGDVRQCFDPDAVRAFVRPFADPSVGAVCGSLEVAPGTDAVSGGVDAHWKLENFVRRQEAAIDSSIGYTGAICAIRHSAFRPIPEDTVLDDVVIPMLITLQGYRVVYERTARGHDPQPFSQAIEKKRKRRTMAGNFQMLFRYPAWLLPWRNRLWWQLISHKYLRLCGMPLMLGCLAANLLLLHLPLYRILLVCQVLFYALAAVGLLLPGIRLRCVSLPAGFVFVNWRTMVGLHDYLRGTLRQGWEHAA